MTFPQRRIGSFSVSAIGLGCMNLSHAYGARPAEEDAVALLNHALARFNTLAAEAGCTPAQLSLAWVLAKGEDMVPIPGTHSIAHLEENLRAVDVRLDEDMIARIEALFTPETIRGNRYSPAVQAQIDTEMFNHDREGVE